MGRSAHLLLGLAVGIAAVLYQTPVANAQPLIAPSSFSAASVSQGRNSIHGHVFGVSRRPLPDVYVELQDDVYSTLARAKTDGSGRYSFRGLRQGNYKVKVLPYGTDYMEQVQDVAIVNISIAPGGGGDSQQVDFYLKPRPNTNAGPLAAPGAIFVQEVPEEAKKLYEKGINELREKKEKEGFESLKRSIETFPTYFLALDRLGTEYVVRGYYEAARVLLIKALEVNPRSYSSRLGLGLAQYHLMQTDQAIENLRYATTLYDKSASTYLWFGLALKRTGKLDQAEAAFKRANELSKGKAAEVHWQMARLYGEQKRYKEAADALELFLKNQSDARDAEKIKQLIKQLREKAATQ